MYRNKIIILGIITFCLFFTHQSFASTSNGTISDTERYAWGENVGFIDFGSQSGNVHITDTALTGYAYGENIGWINLSSITNDREGHLSGYAWGENVGFIDFSQVEIDNHGYFTGSAYGENIGFILFNKDDTNIVTTDWRPKSSRSSGSSSGSSPQVIAKFNQEQIERAEATGQTIPQTNTNLNLTRTLKYGMSGDDVKALQIYLNTHNYTLTTTGPGSPNNETTYFGLKTKQAVIKFQKANNLIGDGIVGPLTRAKMN